MSALASAALAAQFPALVPPLPPGVAPMLLPQHPPALRELVADAVDAFDAAVRVVCGPAGSPEPDAPGVSLDPRVLESVCRLDDLPGFFESVLEWDAEAADPAEIAALAWTLSRPALRDIGIVGWCGGLDAGHEALAAQLRWEAGEEYPAALAMHMWGDAVAPDPARLENAFAAVSAVIALAPEGCRAGPLATAAWLAWALDRTALAETLASQACVDEPEHGLGEIVQSFVHAGHRAQWRGPSA